MTSKTGNEWPVIVCGAIISVEYGWAHEGWQIEKGIYSFRKICRQIWEGFKRFVVVFYFKRSECWWRTFKGRTSWINKWSEGRRAWFWFIKAIHFNSNSIINLLRLIRWNGFIVVTLTLRSISYFRQNGKMSHRTTVGKQKNLSQILREKTTIWTETNHSMNVNRIFAMCGFFKLQKQQFLKQHCRCHRNWYNVNSFNVFIIPTLLRIFNDLDPNSFNAIVFLNASRAKRIFRLFDSLAWPKTMAKNESFLHVDFICIFFMVSRRVCR